MSDIRNVLHQLKSSMPSMMTQLADSAGEAFRLEAARLTPVDTGALQRAWRTLETVQIEGGVASTTENNLPYAFAIDVQKRSRKGSHMREKATLHVERVQQGIWDEIVRNTIK